MNKRMAHKRNALGRGLDALLSMDDVRTEGSSSIREGSVMAGSHISSMLISSVTIRFISFVTGSASTPFSSS